MKKPAKRHEAEYTTGQILKAWSPFAILTVCVSLWTLKGLQNVLDAATIKIQWPGLHNLVMKAAPIVAEPTAYAAEFKLNLLGAVGTSILLAALISAALLHMRIPNVIKTFFETLLELRLSILSIGLVLGFAFVANYSGLSSTLALVLAGTGAAFPFFSPFLPGLSALSPPKGGSACLHTTFCHTSDNLF